MGSAAVTCFAKAHWHLRIARQSNVAAIPGLGAIIELLLNLAPFLIPILIDFYAERVFKTRLYGRVAEIVIRLIGGLGLATVPLMIWSGYYY